MVVSGVGVIALVVLSGIVAVGLSPARPAIIMSFSGLIVGVGAVLTLAIEQTVGLLTMIVGLTIGAVAVRRDAIELRNAKAPVPEASSKD